MLIKLSFHLPFAIGKKRCFFPFWHESKKKISDFFTDEKFSRNEKENIEVLISENEIIWIIGYRADDRFKVTDKTQNVIRFQIQEV
jgi:tRNA(Ile)-lysidine synthase